MEMLITLAMMLFHGMLIIIALILILYIPVSIIILINDYITKNLD